MRRNKWRLWLVVGSFLLGLYLSLPTFVQEPPDWLEGALVTGGAKLGLDLQGGMYLVLGVDTDAALRGRLQRIRHEVEQWAGEQGVALSEASVTGTTLTLTIAADAVEPLRGWVEANWGPTLAVEVKRRVEGRARIVVRFSPQEERRLRDWAVLQSIETIRNRVDQFGIAEPVIQRQGEERIVVQLPGVEDPERAVALIGRTAQLTFHLLRDDVQVPDLEEQVDALIARHPGWRRDVAALNAALAATLPAGVAVRFQRLADEYGARAVPVLVSAEPLLTGDHVVDARVRLSSQYNEPYVVLEFDKEGGKIFADITGANVGKRLAIVLDDVVYSAPVIREKIPGGRASIEGGFTMDEARDLAIVLRAGALPAPVRILEERTVGPSLGQDSIREGVWAIVIGGLLVMLFMAVYYRYAGIVADVSLVANLLYMVAILGLFGATLTLPGLAGIVLTVGMAVDGNVIVYERIREELRLGKSVRAAVDAGFAKALSTILDANITTLIAAIVLFQFGTGPVRGFAVTLTVGILTTLFSVLVVSRTLIDLYVYRRGVRSLPI